MRRFRNWIGILLGLVVIVAAVVLMRPRAEDPLSKWQANITFDQSFYYFGSSFHGPVHPSLHRSVILVKTDLKTFAGELKTGLAPSGSWTWKQVLDGVGSHGAKFHYEAFNGSERIILFRQGTASPGVRLSWTRELTPREAWQLRLRRFLGMH